MGSKWGRRRCGQSLCEIVSFFLHRLGGGFFFRHGQSAVACPMNNVMGKLMLWCDVGVSIFFYFLFFFFFAFRSYEGSCSFSFRLPCSTVHISWCSAGVLFFSPSLFRFFCAHHGLSFARVQVCVGMSVLGWRFRVFFLSLSYP